MNKTRRKHITKSKRKYFVKNKRSKSRKNKIKGGGAIKPPPPPASTLPVPPSKVPPPASTLPVPPPASKPAPPPVPPPTSKVPGPPPASTLPVPPPTSKVPEPPPQPASTLPVPPPGLSLSASKTEILFPTNDPKVFIPIPLNRIPKDYEVRPDIKFYTPEKDKNDFGGDFGSFFGFKTKFNSQIHCLRHGLRQSEQFIYPSCIKTDEHLKQYVLKKKHVPSAPPPSSRPSTPASLLVLGKKILSESIPLYESHIDRVKPLPKDKKLAIKLVRIKFDNMDLCPSDESACNLYKEIPRCPKGVSPDRRVSPESLKQCQLIDKEHRKLFLNKMIMFLTGNQEYMNKIKNVGRIIYRQYNRVTNNNAQNKTDIAEEELKIKKEIEEEAKKFENANEYNKEKLKKNAEKKLKNFNNSIFFKKKNEMDNNIQKTVQKLSLELFAKYHEDVTPDHMIHPFKISGIDVKFDNENEIKIKKLQEALFKIIDAEIKDQSFTLEKKLTFQKKMNEIENQKSVETKTKENKPLVPLIPESAVSSAGSSAVSSAESMVSKRIEEMKGIPSMKGMRPSIMNKMPSMMNKMSSISSYF